MSVRAGDVYAAGMAIGRVLQEHNANPEMTAAIADIMQKLEYMAGERRFPEARQIPSSQE